MPGLDALLVAVAVTLALAYVLRRGLRRLRRGRGCGGAQAMSGRSRRVSLTMDGRTLR